MATFNVENGPPMMHLKWSPREKAIARKAFDRALKQELEAAIHEAKRMAAKIEQPSDLWKLEHYLTQRRKEIDRKYDYRRSVLPLLFGELINQGLLNEKELEGLAEDKLTWIRRHATALES